jgi:hypothetical protein
MSTYSESSLEKAFKAWLAGRPDLVATGADLRQFMESREPTSTRAVVVRGYATENMNTGCQAGGNVWISKIEFIVLGSMVLDQDHAIHNRICGQVQEAIQDVTAADINGLLAAEDKLYVHGIVFSDPSNGAFDSGLVGTTMCTVQVFYERT